MLRVTQLKSNLHLGNIFDCCQENHPLFFNFISSKSEINILDLGCGVPYHIFYFYHTFNTKIITGVDRKDEMRLVSDFNNLEDPNRNSKKKAKSFFEIYSREFNTRNPFRDKIKSKEKFTYEISSKICCIGLLHFLSRCQESYDVIIASNILHFTGDKRILVKEIEHIQRILADDGLVCIRVQNKERFCYDTFKNTITKFFRSGDLLEFFDANDWKSSVFINHQNLINIDAFSD